MKSACPFCGRTGVELVGDGPDAFCEACAALVDVPAALRHLQAETSSRPARLGKYEIVRELGRGGTGVVYEARDLDLHRSVALKVLSEHGLEDRTLQRFLREARVLARVRHPNVVEIHDLGQEAGSTFIAMDFIEGVPFPGTSDRSEGLRRLVAVARALEHIHRQGIVHRDLKPSNILVEPGGRPVIMDFGIARDTEASTVMTGPGAVIGTPGYMAPEQVTGETREADARADVYALGVLLFEVLTGKLPYSGGGIREYAQAIQRGKIPSPRDRGAQVPVALDAVCRKALSIAPSGRYADAGPFADALEAAARSRPRRRLIVGAVGLVGVAGLLAVLAWKAPWSAREAPPPDGAAVDEATRRWTRVMNGAMPFESALAELLECEKLLRSAGEAGQVGLGRLYAELGRHEDSAAVLDEVLARDPANLEALLARGGGIVSQQLEIQFDRKSFPHLARALGDLLSSREGPRMDALGRRSTGGPEALARAYAAIARGDWEGSRRALDSAPLPGLPPRMRDEVQFLHATVTSLAEEAKGPVVALARTEEESAFTAGEREVWVTMIRHLERKSTKPRPGGGLSSRTRVHGALLRVEGSVWESKGDRARALEALARAASAAPGYLLARLHRARLLRETGNRDGAAREVEEVARRATALRLRPEALSEIRS